MPRTSGPWQCGQARGRGSGEAGAGKEADFAGAFDASDATHIGALAMRAGERTRGGAWGGLGGKAQRRSGQSGSGQGHAQVAAVVAEQTVVADFGEAPGGQMQAQPADELDAGQSRSEE